MAYPLGQEEKYQEFYTDYSYTLHDFQKWSVEAIASRNHVLICAPTGSGKTFGGDFALSFFHRLGKKTIYTCPIKALSNEKFYQFSRKYPHIRFGLITGDIRCNPDADVLIMTTEILHNKLVQLQHAKEDTDIKNKNTSFEINIAEDLGCVVFDEIHMIGDEQRGTVWENTLMMLSPHIQIVGLSATLSNPERFATWIENRHDEKHDDKYGEKEEKDKKIVYLTKQTLRAVPLTHYAFIAAPSAIFKLVKDKTVQEQVRNIIDKPLLLQNANGIFHETNYSNIRKTMALFEKNRVKVKRAYVLNQLCKHMVKEEMFPALCYVFSRKQLEICAHEVSTNLLEFDSKIPYTVERECDTILRERLPNFEEYLHLPEYVNLIKLLQKGIAIHHAGLMPVLKELVEILFARGFIKLLFCTETMSVGINLPVKTTIFTGISKYSGKDGGQHRLLHSFEMTQAAGRAGRLGQDAVGNVIHLNNLFSDVDSMSYKNMLSGVPQHLKSQFRISYTMILQKLQQHSTISKTCEYNGSDYELISYANKSMMYNDIQMVLSRLFTELSELKSFVSLSCLKIDANVLLEYMECCEKLPKSVNKQRKQLEKIIAAMHDEYTKNALTADIAQYEKNRAHELKINLVQQAITMQQELVQTETTKGFQLLFKRGFFESDTMQQVAQKIHEVSSLPFAEMICNNNNNFITLNAIETVSVLSCFASVRVPEEKRVLLVPEDTNVNVKNTLDYIRQLYDEYEEIESREYMNTGEEYTMQFDLISFVQEWCECKTPESCKLVLQKVGEKNIFTGEFVKALLKINSISAELEVVAEYLGNIVWLSILRQIPALTLKFVATNQSLYV